jgi:hypothetical protein
LDAGQRVADDDRARLAAHQIATAQQRNVHGPEELRINVVEVDVYRPSGDIGLPDCPSVAERRIGRHRHGVDARMVAESAAECIQIDACARW